MFNLALLRKFVFPVTFLAGAAVSYSAQAATLVEDVNIQTPQTSAQEYFGTAFAEFNPALGTLNSLTFDITGSYTGSSDLLLAIAFLVNEGATPASAAGLTSHNAIQQLSGPAGSFSYTDTDTADAPFFSGTGVVQIGDLLRVQGGSFDSLTVAADSTVTYNYTPAISATPLPAALPLFAGGLGLLGFVSRRKRKAV